MNLSHIGKIGKLPKAVQDELKVEAVNRFLAEADELEQTSSKPIIEKLALWLAARYVVVMRKEVDKAANGELDLKLFREFCGDIVALQRGYHSAERLKIEQERLKRERERTVDEVLSKFEDWTETGKVRDCLCKGWLTPEQRKELIRAILFPHGKPKEEESPAPPGSNPVKPGQTKTDPIQPDQPNSENDDAAPENHENPA